MPNKFKLLAGFFILTLLLFLSTAVAFADGEKEGIIIADDLNVRESPGTSANVIAQVSSDTRVKVLSYSDDWYEISYGDIKGWVYSWFIFVEDEVVAIGSINGDDVNVRTDPNLDCEIITKASKGQEVVVYGRTENWYHIGFSEITGWVFGDYLSTQEKPASTGTINGNDVNIRSKADINSDIITKLHKGNAVDVYGKAGDWYKIRTPDNRIGWVFKDLLSVSESKISRGGSGDTSTAQPSKTEKSNSSVKQQIVDYAKKFLGVKYVWGGQSPNGFDCSGFVWYVYKHFGYTLERTSSNQSKHGTKINRSDLLMGDLVFFDTNGGNNGVNHVGLYIGDGKFIHASSSSSAGKKVRISTLDSGFYYNSFMGARRYVK